MIVLKIWNSFVKPFDDDAGIFCDNKINTMAADVLDPCVHRPSTGMVLII